MTSLYIPSIKCVLFISDLPVENPPPETQLMSEMVLYNQSTVLYEIHIEFTLYYINRFTKVNIISYIKKENYSGDQM